MSRNKAQIDGLHVPLLNGHANKEAEGDMTLTVLGCGKLWQDPSGNPCLIAHDCRHFGHRHSLWHSHFPLLCQQL